MRNLKNNKEKEQTEEYQVFDEVKPAHISVPLSFPLLFKCFMLVLVLILQVFQQMLRHLLTIHPKPC